MGIYEKFTESYNTLPEISSRVRHFAEVLTLQGFKVADELRTSVLGIDKIEVPGKAVIKPTSSGFLEYDVADLIELVADPSCQIEVKPPGWFSIEGFYRKVGNGNPAPLRAVIQVYKPSVSITPIERIARRFRGPKPAPIEATVILGYDPTYLGPMTSKELVERMSALQKDLQVG